MSGITDLRTSAEAVRRQGRHGDSVLVHMSPAEFDGIAAMMPTNHTINPSTGLPEMFEWTDILPIVGTVIGAYFGGPVGAAAGGAIGGAIAGGTGEDGSADKALTGALIGGVGGYFGGSALGGIAPSTFGGAAAAAGAAGAAGAGGAGAAAAGGFDAAGFISAEGAFGAAGAAGAAAPATAATSGGLGSILTSGTFDAGSLIGTVGGLGQIGGGGSHISADPRLGISMPTLPDGSPDRRKREHPEGFVPGFAPEATYFEGQPFAEGGAVDVNPWVPGSASISNNNEPNPWKNDSQWGGNPQWDNNGSAPYPMVNPSDYQPLVNVPAAVGMGRSSAPVFEGDTPMTFPTPTPPPPAPVTPAPSPVGIASIAPATFAAQTPNIGPNGIGLGGFGSGSEGFGNGAAGFGVDGYGSFGTEGGEFGGLTGADSGGYGGGYGLAADGGLMQAKKYAGGGDIGDTLMAPFRFDRLFSTDSVGMFGLPAFLDPEAAMGLPLARSMGYGPEEREAKKKAEEEAEAEEAWNTRTITPTIPAFANGGIIGYADGGQIPQDGNDQAMRLREETKQAIRGQHPAAQQIIALFIETFGQEAFNQLQQEVMSEEATSGPQGAPSQLTRGPGGGLDDLIPAQIAGGGPAKLSDGEFVVPADVVSGLGDGSTNEGERRLAGMVANTRQQRTGTPVQPAKVNPAFMPR